MFGGAGFASALIAAGLVDEIQLYVNPAVLGDGVGIFEISGFQPLRLIEVASFRCGMIVSRYRPACWAGR
ncbi:dihydrofolate reductase family protein [Flavisphingomonas formosensis]|uniref:dihydrofolate reductase family protein n=1 Tax=Flavisphingomonas formosensis TaxID=861534 RepID=UPI0018DFB249